MLSRMAFMVGFIGHLYLADWLSNFKGLSSHWLNVTSLRTGHHLPDHPSFRRQIKNLSAAQLQSCLNNWEDAHFDWPPAPSLTMVLAQASEQVGLSPGSSLLAAMVAATSLPLMFAARGSRWSSPLEWPRLPTKFHFPPPKGGPPPSSLPVWGCLRGPNRRTGSLTIWRLQDCKRRANRWSWCLCWSSLSRQGCHRLTKMLCMETYLNNIYSIKNV